VQSFLYRRLNSDNYKISLLVLQPGKGALVVEVEMICTSFDENPKYEALSYCWGDSKDTWLI
jgi:hypothetical protein